MERLKRGRWSLINSRGNPKGLLSLFTKQRKVHARASLIDPIQKLDGHQLNCKLSVDSKKSNNVPNSGGVQGPPSNRYGRPALAPGSMPGPNYGMGSGAYGGYSRVPAPALGHQGAVLNSSIGGGNYGNQGPSSNGGASGGYSAGSYDQGGQQYGPNGYAGMSNSASMYPKHYGKAFWGILRRWELWDVRFCSSATLILR